MKRTLLRWHLGLGDALLCNGLVRVLVDRGQQLVLPCWKQNEPSVRAMFADLGEYVDTIVVTDGDHPMSDWTDCLSLGHYGEHFDPLRFDASFYGQAGVPFLAKWEKFQYGEGDPLGASLGKCDRLVHDDEARGFVIPLEGYRPERTDDLSNHIPALLRADEIHCISSCFAILADLINAPGKKFLHRYSRPDGGSLPVFGREWVILDKPL